MGNGKNDLESFTTGIVVLRAGYVLLMVWVFCFWAGYVSRCPYFFKLYFKLHILSLLILLLFSHFIRPATRWHNFVILNCNL